MTAKDPIVQSHTQAYYLLYFFYYIFTIFLLYFYFIFYYIFTFYYIFSAHEIKERCSRIEMRTLPTKQGTIPSFRDGTVIGLQFRLGQDFYWSDTLFWLTYFYVVDFILIMRLRLPSFLKLNTSPKYANQNKVSDQ